MARSRFQFILVSILLAFAVFTAGAGCSRPSEAGISSVSIRAPGREQFHKASALHQPFPPEKKVCFGLQVLGPDIPLAQANSCAPKVGITSGFVAEGELLTVTVPKGSDRTFELLVYLAEPSEKCPAFDPAFQSHHVQLSRTHVSGRRAGVKLEKDEESVILELNFPGAGTSTSLFADAPAACVPAPALRAYADSSGHVMMADGSVNPVLSSATTEWFYLTTLPGPRASGRINTSGLLNMAQDGELAVPPGVGSVTRKPDSGEFYGLWQDGTVVRLQVSGSASTAMTLEGAACPFQAPNCRVPPWMQSISAGFGSKLYGLDHGGQIYEITSTGPQALGQTVPEQAVQVSFY